MSQHTHIYAHACLTTYMQWGGVNKMKTVDQCKL